MTTKNGFSVVGTAILRFLFTGMLLLTLVESTVGHMAYAAPLSATSPIVASVVGGNGSISPSGTVYVEDGTTQTFTITPNLAYTVDMVIVNSISRNADLVSHVSGSGSIYFTIDLTGGVDPNIDVSFKIPPEDIVPGVTINPGDLPVDNYLYTFGWRSSTVTWGDPAPIYNKDKGGDCDSNLGGATAWYNFTPSTTEYLYLDTLGTVDYDTMIAVWEGVSGPETLVACNNQNPNVSTETSSALTFLADASQGKTYYIEILHWINYSGLDTNYGGRLYFHMRRANTEVYIGGELRAGYEIPSGTKTAYTNWTLNDGPVQVVSTTGELLITSERAYRDPVNLTDFNEMMGMPVDHLTIEYWFPAYDGRSTFMKTWLTIGNASTDTANKPTAIVDVYIGGVWRQQFEIAYGAKTAYTNWNLNEGPVRVISTNGVPIIASERAYRDPVNLTDFNEMMGMPADHLTIEYWFPAYDGRSTFMKTWLTIGNASTDSANKPTAIVDVYIGGVFRQQFEIGYGAKTAYTNWNLNEGPVRVISTNGVPIITSERAYRDPVNLTDFNEMMGMPVDHLKTEYWFPTYDGRSTFMKTWLTIGNASTDSANKPTAIVDVYIGGVWRQQFEIGYGAKTAYTNWTLNDGPVQVISTNGVPIITSERAYRDPVNLTDFNEMMGMPVDHLKTEYWFPTYDGRSTFMKTWLTIGNAQ